MMKILKTKCTQIVICEISKPSKKNITSILVANIENVLKLKRITKFNMIMIIIYFYLNSYNYNSIKDLIHYL
jgi:hypothetical protein